MIKYAGCLLLGVPLLAWADADWNLLDRAAQAGRSQVLAGTYTHSVDGDIETFRVYRAKQGQSIRERRVSVDGMARELIRVDNELTCYAPDPKALSLAKVNAIKLFPAILPERSQDLQSTYKLTRGKRDRVAQTDCQWLHLNPKAADMRYSMKVCVEDSTALPLKVVTSDARGGVIEQFSFSDVSLTAPKDRQLLSPNYKNSLALGAALATKSDVMTPDYEVKGLPAGFRLLRYAHRALPGSERVVSHFVYTDGLAKFSLFVESGVAAVNASGSHVIAGPGGIGMVSRQSGNKVLTVVGDLPQAGLNSLIGGVRVSKK